MKNKFLKIVIIFAFLLGTAGQTFAWNPATHQAHLTKVAIKLLNEIYAKKYSEIEDYGLRIGLGAHDEDYPVDPEYLKFLATHLFSQYFGRPIREVYLRSYNHYFHALSGTGLSKTPFVTTMGDPDVDTLTWAKSNANLSKKEEFGDGAWKAKSSWRWSDEDLNDGNMSWERAINRYDYMESSKALAYYTLGFVLHLLQDMGEPEHVHDDPHGASGYTGFEIWVARNWHGVKNHFIPAMDELRPKEFPKMDDYFHSLSKIAYSSSRFETKFISDRYIDHKCNLARMFDIDFNPQTGKWGLYNPKPKPKVPDRYYKPLNTLNPPIVFYSPKEFKKDPFSHKGEGNGGGFWPTDREVLGGKNDAHGFFYIELSDEFPRSEVTSERELYPSAYLPTPLPGVGNDCEGWEVKHIDIDNPYERKHLYQLIAERVLPRTIEYTAGLIKLYHDIVNHPPFVKSVQILQSSEYYSRSWSERTEETSDSKRILRVTKRIKRERQENKHRPLESGKFEIKISFSEPVNSDVLVRIGSFNVEGSLDESATTWRGEFEIPSDYSREGVHKIIIAAKDKHNHYENTGADLDSKPDTPARRVTNDGNSYTWENYEPGPDMNHEVLILKADEPEPKEWCLVLTEQGVVPMDKDSKARCARGEDFYFMSWGLPKWFRQEKKEGYVVLPGIFTDWKELRRQYNNILSEMHTKPAVGIKGLGIYEWGQYAGRNIIAHTSVGEHEIKSLNLGMLEKDQWIKERPTKESTTKEQPTKERLDKERPMKGQPLSSKEKVDKEQPESPEPLRPDDETSEQLISPDEKSETIKKDAEQDAWKDSVDPDKKSTTIKKDTEIEEWKQAVDRSKPSETLEKKPESESRDVPTPTTSQKPPETKREQPPQLAAPRPLKPKPEDKKLESPLRSIKNVPRALEDLGFRIQKEVTKGNQRQYWVYVSDYDKAEKYGFQSEMDHILGQTLQGDKYDAICWAASEEGNIIIWIDWLGDKMPNPAKFPAYIKLHRR